MNNDEVLKTLQRLSKRFGIPIVEIDYMARMIAQADTDPLSPEEWGKPFDYDNYRKVSLNPDDIFSGGINAEVPEPNAQVDLLTAWRNLGVI